MDFVRFIHCQASELAAYNTGRLVATALCGNSLRIQAPYSGMSETYSWHGFRRDPDGTPAMSEEAAERIGVMTWVAVVVTAALAFGPL